MDKKHCKSCCYFLTNNTILCIDLESSEPKLPTLLYEERQKPDTLAGDNKMIDIS